MHRIYKDMVPHTNRHDLPRDLVLHESQAQVLRFIAKGCTFEDIQNPNPANIGSKLADLIKLGIFNNAYIAGDSGDTGRNKRINTRIS